MQNGVREYNIALTLSRRTRANGQMPVIRAEGLRPVRVMFYNSQMDYSILELQDNGADLAPIPIWTGNIEQDTDLKVFYSPIGMFLDSSADDTLSVFTNWVKTGRPTAHHVKCTGGLFSGSSGSPYVTRNGFVVGIHLESASERRIVEIDFERHTDRQAIEIISQSHNSNANCHASLTNALLIYRCTKLRQQLQELRII
jgi:hypothetical protein